MDFKALAKKLEAKGTISTDFSEPDYWLDTGNYALNYAMSGDFLKGIPNRRTIMLAGPSGTGKSYLAANFVKHAQDAEYAICYIDTEDAIDRDFMTRLGIDIVDRSKFIPARVKTIEDCAEAVSNVFTFWQPGDKVMIVIDSLGNLGTDAEVEKFEKSGELQNDMGIWSKKAKQLMRDMNFMASNKDCIIVMTNHSYQNQDQRNGKGVNIIRGGDAILYLPSITWMLTKLKMKDEGGKTVGIRLKGEIMKTRFNQLGTRVEIDLPYTSGMEPTSGLKDFLIQENLIQQSGAWYKYTDKDGKEQKFHGETELPQHIDAIFATYKGKQRG